MVEYGSDKKHLFEIANLDCEPDLCGVKVGHLPYVTCSSIIPLLFNNLFLSVFFLLISGVICFFIKRAEDQGDSLIMKKELVKASDKMPFLIRKLLFKELALVRSFGSYGR